MLARKIAYGYAGRLGVDANDAHDCAGDFVTALLEVQCADEEQRTPLRSDLPPQDAIRYLRASALHFVLRWARIRRRRAHYELSLTIVTGPSLSAVAEAAEVTAVANLAYTNLLHEIEQAFTSLPALQQHVFVQVILRHKEPGEVAHACGRSQAAVRQALHRARVQVRARLHTHPLPPVKKVFPNLDAARG